jgi:hypothetical protein
MSVFMVLDFLFFIFFLASDMHFKVRMAEAFGRKEIGQGSTVSQTGLHGERYWDRVRIRLGVLGFLSTMDAMKPHSKASDEAPFMMH